MLMDFRKNGVLPVTGTGRFYMTVSTTTARAVLPVTGFEARWRIKACIVSPFGRGS